MDLGNHNCPICDRPECDRAQAADAYAAIADQVLDRSHVFTAEEKAILDRYHKARGSCYAHQVNWRGRALVAEARLRELEQERG